MKTPKRNMENTTTKMEMLMLLFLLPFIVVTVSEFGGLFLRRGGCMVERKSEQEKKALV